MNKVNPITCVATSNQKVEIPDNNGRNIVLYFYPKDDTPGCTIEGNDFSQLNESFSKKNTVIYGVSKDDMASHEKFKANQSFPFELIADEDGTLCEAFGAWQLKKRNGEEKMGIVRSTFIINPNGDILKSWDKVAVGGHVDEVLEAVQAL